MDTHQATISTTIRNIGQHWADGMRPSRPLELYGAPGSNGGSNIRVHSILVADNILASAFTLASALKGISERGKRTDTHLVGQTPNLKPLRTIPASEDTELCSQYRTSKRLASLQYRPRWLRCRKRSHGLQRL